MFIVKKTSKGYLQNKTASTFKIALWYTFSNVFVKGLSALSLPFFTRILSPEEYGNFSTFTSWESILLILVTLNFSASISRAKYDFDEKMNEYILSILIGSNILTLGIYALTECYPVFFETLFSMSQKHIRILFIYLIFMPAFSYLQLKHRIYKKYIFFVVFSISSAIIRTIISIFLVTILENKYDGMLYGYLIPISLFNMVLWGVILVQGKKISWIYIRYAGKIAIPMIPHALANTILGNSDRIMITHYQGSEYTAFYSLAYSVSLLAELIWTSMNQAWTPWLYDNMYEKKWGKIKKNSSIYIGGFSALIIAIFLISPEIIMILGGNGYYSARYVMPPIILGCAFRFIYGMYVNIEIFSKRTFSISLGTIAAAALNLFLNWLFIPQYGYIAAAYTTMIGYAALLVFHYYIVKKTLKKYSGLYETKFIIYILLLLIISGSFSLLLYQYNIIRYIFVLIYMILGVISLYKHKEKILNLIK